MTEMLREISSRHLSHKCKLSPTLGLRLHGQSTSRERGEGAAASALHVWGRTKPASNLGLCSALAGSEEGPNCSDFLPHGKDLDSDRSPMGAIRLLMMPSVCLALILPQVQQHQHPNRLLPAPGHWRTQTDGQTDRPLLCPAPPKGCSKMPVCQCRP